MGKTKLLMEVRKTLERINTTTTEEGRQAFHLFYGIADIANKTQVGGAGKPQRTIYDNFKAGRPSTCQVLRRCEHRQQDAGGGGQVSSGASQ